MATYSVRGEVLSAGGVPYSGDAGQGHVRAYHVAIDEVASATTPAGALPATALGTAVQLANDGTFLIEYDPQPLFDANVRSPNIMVLISRELETTTEVFRSDICFRSGADELIRIRFGGATAAAELQAELSGPLGSLSLNQLTDEQTGYVISSSRLDRGLINYARAASSWVGGNQTRLDTLLALTNDGDLSSPLQKLMRSDAELSAVAAAASDDGWAVTGAQLQQERASLVEGYIAGSDTQARGLVVMREAVDNGIFADAADAAQFVETYLNHPAHTGSTVDPISVWDGNEQLRLAFQLHQITRGNSSLVWELVGQVSSSGYTLEAVAALSSSTFSTAVQSAGIGGVPSDVPGANDTERLANYATILDRIISELEPSARFRRDMAGSTHWPFTASTELTDLLGRPESNNIPLADIYSWADLSHEAAPNEHVRRAGAIQRLLRITRYFPAAEALAADGLTSAQQVVRISGRRFVELYGSSFGSNLLAYEAYRRSERFASVVEVVREREAGRALVLPDAMGRTVSFEDFAADLAATVGAGAWSAMFGSPDACDCAHGDSVFGPAAYLYDLLAFLRTATWDEGTSPNNTGLDLLSARRPDIQALLLTARNAERRLPFVDLVNDILESQLSSASAVLETTGLEEELAAYPEVVRASVYDALRVARFPRSLPFDLWREEVRSYLRSVRVELADVYAAHTALGPTGRPSSRTIASAWVRERLNLSSTGYVSVTTTANLADDFGLGASPDWTTWDDDVEGLLRVCGLEATGLDELDAALRTRLVDDSTTASVDKPPGACSLADLSVSLTASRAAGLNIVLRLHRATALKAFELDQILNLWTASSDPATWMRPLALTLDIADALDASPVAVAQVWRSELDTHSYSVWGSNEPDRSYYERIFLPRGTADELAGSPLNPASLGTVAESLPQLAAGLRLPASTVESLALSMFSSSAATLTLSDLAVLHKAAVLIRGLDLPVADYLQMVDVFNRITGVGSGPFANPDSTFDFVHLVKSVREAGLSAADLAYVVLGNAHEDELTEAEAISILGDLQEQLMDIGSAEDRATLVVETLATMFDVEADVAPHLFTVTGPNVQALWEIGAATAEEQRTAVRSLHKLALLAERLGLTATEVEALGGGDTGPWGGTALWPGSTWTDESRSQWWRIQRYLTTKRRSPALAEALIESAVSPGPVTFEDYVVSHGTAASPSHPDRPRPVSDGGLLVVVADVNSGTPGELSGVSYGGRNLTLGGRAEVDSHAIEIWSLSAADLEIATDDSFAFSTTTGFEEYRVVSLFLRRAGVVSVSAGAPSGVPGGLAIFATDADGAANFAPESAPGVSVSSTAATTSIWIATTLTTDQPSVGIAGQASLWVTVAPAVPSATPSVQAIARLAESTGWSADEFDAVVGGFSGSTPETPMVLAGWFFVEGDRTGLSPSTLRELTPVATIDQGLAGRVRNSVRAALGDGAYLKRAAEIRASLRERQQDALVARMLSQSLALLGVELQDRTDLYEHLLIDVQMTSAVTTSRLMQAVASIQLLLQRTVLGLEPLSGLDKDDWGWRSRYRVWEANRRIFLYPENYLLPELRRAKTALFEEFETELLEGPLTGEVAKDAMDKYIDGLRDISFLTPMAICELREQVGGASQANAEASTIVLARSGGIGGPLYMQTWKNHQFWTGWRPIELDVVSEHIFLARLLGELFLFWFTWAEVGPTPSSVAVPTTEGPGRQPNTNIEGTLNYAVLRRGRWTKARKGTTPVRYERGTSDEPMAVIVSKVRFLVTVDGASAVFIGFNDVQRNISGNSTFARSRSGIVFDATDEACVTTIGYEPPTQWPQNTFYQAIRQGDVQAMLTRNPFERGPLRPLLNPSGALRAELVISADAFCPTLASPMTVKIGRGAYIVSAGGFQDEAGERAALSAASLEVDYSAWDRYRDLDTSVSFLAQFRQPVSFSPTFTPTAQVEFPERFGSRAVPARTECITLAPPEPPLEESSDHSSHFVEAVFKPLFVPESDSLLRLWRLGRFDDLFSVETQTSTMSTLVAPFDALGPTDFVADDYPASSLSFDQRTPSGIYAWELFFHAPVRIASSLLADGQFEEARRWLHAVFDPTRAEAGPAAIWRFFPFHEWIISSRQDAVEELVSGEPTLATRRRRQQNDSAMVQWKENPFDPHAVAGVRIEAYMRWTVFTYLDVLIEWGDSLFAQDTFETVGEAAQLYILAQELLGREPVLIPADSGSSESYGSLQSSPNQIPFSDLYLESILAFEDAVTFEAEARDDAPETPAKFAGPRNYFCTPVNKKLIGYWKTVQDRLFKVRHSLNLHGVSRVLALSAPPIDPLLLARAAAAGLSIQQIVSGGRLGAVRPPFRFTTVISQAIEMCEQLKSLATQMLASLEKQDAERVSLLVKKNAVRLLDQQRSQREQALKEAQAQLAALEKSRERAVSQAEYYASRVELNEREEKQLKYMDQAFGLQMVANMLAAGVGPASAVIPDLTIGAQGWGSTPVAQGIFGGRVISRGVEFSISASQAASAALGARASRVGVRAAHQRRFEEFTFQTEQARRDVEQVEAQIAAAELRVAISEHEIRLQDLQLEQQKREEDALTTKFSNRELYTWMSTQLRTLYSRAYDLAHEMGRRAETCYNYELGRSDSFIKASYWDGLRKGLLAGEHLAHDLRRLQAAYTINHVRELEHTAHFSLFENAPERLLDLLNEGTVSGVRLTEQMYDRQYVGLYKRRIQSVSVTIYGVAGPMDGIRLSLAQSQSWIRYDDSDFTASPVVLPGGERIITTTGLQDGMVAGDDGRYLPFERTGAISEWVLDLDFDANAVDRDSIRDVVFHVRYTALESQDATFTDAAREEAFYRGDDATTGILAISLRSSRPDVWSAWTAGTGSGESVVQVDLRRSELPTVIQQAAISVSSIRAFGVYEGPTTPSFDFNMWPSDASAPSTDAAFVDQPNDPDISLNRYRMVVASASEESLPHAIGEADLGQLWTLRASDVAELARLRDVVLLIDYEVTDPMSQELGGDGGGGGGGGGGGFTNVSAFSFDGVNESIDLGDVATLNGVTQATWNFWIRSSPLSVNEWYASRWVIGHRQWAAYTRGTGLRFYISGSGTSADYGETPTGILVADTWHHVVCIFDGNSQSGNVGRLQIWIDGVQRTLSFSGTIPAALHSSGSGANGNTRWGALSGGTPCFAGRGDELALWAGVAASSGQVAELYASASTPAGAPDLDALLTMPSPSHWWRADGDDPLTAGGVVDHGSASTTYDGTAVNMDSSNITSI